MRIDSMGGVQVSSERQGVPYLSPPPSEKPAVNWGTGTKLPLRHRMETMKVGK